MYYPTCIEDRLLIYCLAPSQSTQQLPQMVGQSVDWEHFMRLLQKHRVVLPVYYFLKDAATDLIPSHILDRMRHYTIHQTQRNILLKGELLQVLRQIEQHGIRAMPLKGPYWTEQLYGNLTLREFNDLDILIPKIDIPRTIEVLGKVGYTTPNYKLETILNYGYHLLIENPQRGIRLELHWDLSALRYPLYRKADFLWEYAQVASYETSHLWTPRVEDMLIFLSVHAFRHYWWRLRWLHDIMQLIQAYPNLDWDTVSKCADNYHCQEILSMNATLLYQLFNFKTPILDQHTLGKRRTLIITRRIKRGWASTQQTEWAGLYDFGVITLPLLGNHYDRLRYIVILIRKWLRDLLTLTERDYRLIRLPKYLSFLYYFIRPVRLLKRYGLSLWGR